MNVIKNKDNLYKEKSLSSSLILSNNISPTKLPLKENFNKEKENKIKLSKNQSNLKAKIKNLNYLEIETMLKNTNKTTLKKYSNNLDKKIKYLKYMNSQKYSQNNIITNNSTKNKNYVTENYKLGSHQTRESTNDNNSDNKNYIHTELNSTSKFFKRKNEKLYEEIIKKNIPHNIYYKHRNKNMCFKLKKNGDKTIKNSLETILSKEDIILNYKKFQSSFLISNDSVSISTNTIIKNTNSCFLKFLSFLNNDEILNLFSTNREIRSCIIGSLVYKVKEKILPDFNLKYCQDNLFNDNYNFIILSKFYKKKKLKIRFILTIKPKITKLNKKIINKRIKIGFHEYVTSRYNPNNSIKNINKEKKEEKIKVNTFYSFELIDKKKPKNFWVFRENTSFHYDENSKAYYNDIMQFWPGDKALININLISELGIIDFDKFSWIEPKIAEISNKSKINICEAEQIIGEWNKINFLENGDIVKKNLDDLFGNNFIIQEINYDDVGYFFFKIILKAYKIGSCIGREGNLGIKINIFPINSNITNEIKKNGLIFDENNELAVNVGDIITFYISQNKNGY